MLIVSKTSLHVNLKVYYLSTYRPDSYQIDGNNEVSVHISLQQLTYHRIYIFQTSISPKKLTLRTMIGTHHSFHSFRLSQRLLLTIFTLVLSTLLPSVALAKYTPPADQGKPPSYERTSSSSR